LLCFFEKIALYHPPIPQNKCSTICVGLSLQFLLKKEEERHGLSKKIWTHEGPCIEKKERKNIYGHMKIHDEKK